MTFEQERFEMSKSEQDDVQDALRIHSIDWYSFTWHSGRFKLLKKAFDFLNGIFWAWYLSRKHNVSTVYSEGFPGAILGHFVSTIVGCNHIVHTFEPHADSSIESGEWSPTSWEAKLLKFFEARIAFRASDLLTATEGYANLWKEKGCPARFHRVPSCVDIEHFRFDAESREKTRRELGLKNESRLITYLGKFGGMYWEHELSDLFSVLLQEIPEAYFLIVTIDSPDKVQKCFSKSTIPLERLIITSATRDQVPALLSASDAAVCAVRQKPSKRFCSPIKDGEYWACGLPILIPEGISDDYLFARQKNIGVVINDNSEHSLRKAASELTNLWDREPVSELRKRAREFAKKDRSVESYRSVLRNILLEQ